jgi:hypothetical protein
MAHRDSSLNRRLSYALACALGLALLACGGGGGGDTTAPDPVPPTQDPPAQQPPPEQPPPEQPPPTQPPPTQPPPTQPGVVGSYVLVQINNSQPGQMVTLSNPDGNVIGIYRFDASTALSLDALQTFELQLNFSDEKGLYGIHDQGEFKLAGQAENVLALSFTSAVYQDEFSAIYTDNVVAIKYDTDGDGQADTTFAFQRVG